MQQFLLALLVIAGVFQLGLAGCNINSPHYRPEWIGLACLAAALTWPIVNTLVQQIGG